LHPVRLIPVTLMERPEEMGQIVLLLRRDHCDHLAPGFHRNIAYEFIKARERGRKFVDGRHSFLLSAWFVRPSPSRAHTISSTTRAHERTEIFCHRESI